MEPAGFTLNVQLPLLLLTAAMLLPLTEPTTTQPRQQDGIPVEWLANANENAAFTDNATLCEMQFNKHHEPQTNDGRFCPVIYRWQNSSAGGFPMTTVTSSCLCVSQRKRLFVNEDPPACAGARLPVTELRRIRDQATGAVRFVEELVLRTVECATIEPKPSGLPVLSIPGAVLHSKGQEVGRQLFEQVYCEPSNWWSQKAPRPTFGLRVDSELEPRFQPVARCPCQGEAAVWLPIGILRFVGNGKTLTDNTENVPVSCAILINQ